MNLARQLSSDGNQAIQDLAQRYHVSADAVKTLLFALSEGGGTLAQFSHPELGGTGQWMSGGMTMVGDLFNYSLKATVNGLCSELSSLLGSRQLFVPLPTPAAGASFIAPGNSWWPAELGNPSSSGGQNDARYAYFPQRQRLAILQNGRLAVYDTLNHHIQGVQQQQGGAFGSLTFSSQFGTFSVDSLPSAASGASPATPAAPVSPPPQKPISTPASRPAQEAPVAFSPPAPAAAPSPAGGPSSQDDILKALERLGDLHQKGILTDDEFKSKKAELLSRL
jgi:hypothetical protein